MRTSPTRKLLLTAASCAALLLAGLTGVLHPRRRPGTRPLPSPGDPDGQPDVGAGLRRPTGTRAATATDLPRVGAVVGLQPGLHRPGRLLRAEGAPERLVGRELRRLRRHLRRSAATSRCR